MTKKRRAATAARGERLARLSREQALIQELFAPLASDSPGALGLIDDAALFAPEAGEELVLTVDAIVEGVHCRPGDPADLVARKALRVNLSDLAAKGAAPAGYLLVLALSERATHSWLESFAGGLAADQETFGCALLGGDTVKTPGPFTASITAIGRLPAGAMVRRAGARAGERLYVSGTIGDAGLGLALLDEAPAWAEALEESQRAHLEQRYRLPQPRTALAPVLRAHASAAIDVSDGLAGDLALLCRASGTGATVEANAVPLSPAARAALDVEPGLMARILAAGDDYEIIAAVPEREATAFERAAQAAGVPVAAIGMIEEGTGLPVFRDAQGRAIALEALSYSHL